MQAPPPGRRYGLSHRLAGAGELTGVRRRVRRASARQGAAGRRPTVGGLPTALPLWSVVALGVPVTHFPRGLALLRPIRPGGPDGWRAAGAPLKP
jgi:hypothetical protein